MDLLKAEIERKRKAVELAKSSSDVGKIKTKKRQFLRAADLRRFQERREEEEEQAVRRPQNESSNAEHASASNDEPSSSPKKYQTNTQTKNDDDDIKSGATSPRETQAKHSFSTKLTPTQITDMLRSMGLPIRLFGERTTRLSENETYDDSQRFARLQTAKELSQQAMAGLNEMDEFRLGSGHGIRNPFLGKKNDDDDNRVIDPVKETTADEPTTTTSTTTPGGNDADDNENDPHKKIHHFFKHLLKQWEDDLSSRPDSVKKTPQGKNETKTLKQCRDYIRPLFKLLKTRRLEEGLLNRILNIVDYCQAGEFVKAHDVYMDVAIGRAAWPIGVTMVGIHARSGRSKIESSNVAHVMNSELQRKYLTSVKRLMTYYQKKREDVAPSKKVIN